MAIRYRTKAFERVLKKVEALRMTLPDDEREILDSLIKKNEVEGHKIANRAVGRVAAKAINRKTAKSPEVEAHQMSKKAITRKTSKSAARAIAKKADR
jgi:hypothetical protein